MTGTWKDMSRGRRRLAEKTFEVLSVMDDLLEAEDTGHRGAAREVGFSDLFAYASGASAARDQDVRLALIRNPRLRRDLDRLLAKVSVCHFPRAAAASSGDVDTREGDGFKLRVRRSKAVETQCYVIIDIDPTFDATPTALFVKSRDGGIEKYALPELQDGTIQMLVDAESDLVQNLRDAGTEVYLR